MSQQQIRAFIPDTIIEYAENVLRLIERGVLTREEAREMLGLEPKTSAEIEVDGVKYSKKD